MFENPYKEIAAKLLAGEISEIVVEKADFMLFREMWLAHPERKNIIGEAGLNGKIVYRFQKELQKNGNNH